MSSALLGYRFSMSLMLIWLAESLYHFNSNIFFFTVFLNSKIVKRIFSINLIALILAIALYTVIILTLNKGTTVDEGYYLLSYLEHQNPRIGVSDFDNIVKTFFEEWAYTGNVRELRWARFVLGLVSIIIFSQGSYVWLKNRFGQRHNKLVFYSLILISGTLTYSFGSNTLYYDNIQVILYMLTVGIYFLYYSENKNSAFLIIAGVLTVFAIMNYLLSGLFLLLLIFGFIAIEGVKKKTFIRQLMFLSGFLIGVILYHYLISDIYDRVDAMTSVIGNSDQRNISGHNNSNLILELLKSFSGSVGLLIVLTLVFMVVIRLLNKVSNVISLIAASGFILVFIIFSRTLFFDFRAYVLLIPISLILGHVLENELKKDSNNTIQRKEILYLVALLLIPYAGVFGTNQPLYTKITMFTPFWALIYLYLSGKEEIIVSHDKRWYYNLLFVLIFSFGYLFMGQLRKPHAYYSPNSSAQYLTKSLRFSNIGISSFQADYYNRAVYTLKQNGYHAGEKILAFYENFMTVYAAGGTVPGPLIYSAERFVANSDHLSIDKPKYILIMQYQEEMITKFLKEKPWNFPNEYKRIELGRSAQNLPYPDYNSILYIQKK